MQTVRTTAEKSKEKEKKNTTTATVFEGGRVSSEHVLNMTPARCGLTFERMLCVCLPLPPVVVLGGEFVMLL